MTFGSALKIDTNAVQMAKRGYHFTPEQLAKHDEMIKQQVLKSNRDRLKRETQNFLNDEFASRQRMFEGENGEVLVNVAILTLAIPILVLCRDFGFPRVTNRISKRYRTVRFVEALKAELERVLNDEMIDIRQYAKDVQNWTGVGFALEDLEDTEDKTNGTS